MVMSHALATRCPPLRSRQGDHRTSEPLSVNISLRGLAPRVLRAPTDTPVTLLWPLLAFRHLLPALTMIIAAPTIGAAVKSLIHLHKGLVISFYAQVDVTTANAVSSLI